MDACGYREVEHTADWALEVWAPSVEELIEQAARGMYDLSSTSLTDAERTTRRIVVDAADAETALVGFLEELLYLQESERIAFETFRIELHGSELRADVEGAPVATQDKEIKAVTWHDLEVARTDSGFSARVVFDV